MRQGRWLLVVLLLITGFPGCNLAKGPKVDNPVIGPPPPRVSSAEAAKSGGSRSIAESAGGPKAGTETVPVSYTKSRQSQEYPDSMAVAMVNGEPIFAGELLEPYQAKLKVAQLQLSAEEYGKLREALIKPQLQQAIERKLLVQGLKRGLKEQQLQALDKHLDQAFAERAQELMTQMQVGSLAELEVELEKRGVNIETYRRAFLDQQMAREYLFLNGRPKTEPGRQELLEYYHAHAEEFEYPGRVKWQQIVISDEAHGGRRGAERILNQVANELLRGADFGELAQKFSDGPTAKSGGVWDWTQQGSLADTEVEEILFNLPVGDISPTIRTATGFQIVRVLEREDAGRTSFTEVQADIKKLLHDQESQRLMQEALSELRTGAVIETVFDDQAEATP